MSQKVGRISKDLKRKFPAIWSTIGNFNHPDLNPIDNHSFVYMFSNWKSLKKDKYNYKVGELYLVNYNIRSLIDEEILKTFKL